MRFKLLFPLCVLLFGLAFLAGCPQHEEKFCGDDRCDRPDGEDYQTCPEDCLPVCGDGSCDSDESTQNCSADCQAGPICGDGLCNGSDNSSNCPGDCPTSSCMDPNYPVDCHDDSGVCWTAGTNCASNWFFCGPGERRCNSTSDWAACCYDTFILCDAAYPYYCPVDNLCWSSPPVNCPTNACSFVVGDC